MVAAQLAQASRVASSRSNSLLEEYSGGPKWAWLLFAPPFLLSTPLAFFGDSFFRKVMEIYKFRNDTCFLSVMLRNLDGLCINIFFCFFRHVPEFHKLPNDGCQAPYKDQTKVACHQAKVPGRN